MDSQIDVLVSVFGSIKLVLQRFHAGVLEEYDVPLVES